LSFAGNLSTLMSSNSITTYRLAKELGVHISTVSNWKNGKQPTISHLKMVSDYFKVTTDQLLN
jgi:transcriptional regulator with XRE-family HTH domain